MRAWLSRIGHVVAGVSKYAQGVAAYALYASSALVTAVLTPKRAMCRHAQYTTVALRT